jgi:hypothetical protein
MIENLMTPRVQPLRQSFYDYHRQGLDKMHKEPVVGRTVILGALESIAVVDRNYPNSMIIQMLVNAKQQEILSVFNGGASQEKDRVVEIMTKLDPTNANKYRSIKG